MTNGPEYDSPKPLKKTYVPVCATCKKVRSEDGAWSRSPLAFERPADVLLTHGICPDCARESFREETFAPL